MPRIIEHVAAMLSYKEKLWLWNVKRFTGTATLPPFW